MIDLSTTYMGLKLKNPIIIGSSGLVNSAEKIKKLETAGAGAVVLKSLFEEQILMEIDSLTNDFDSSNYTEGAEYLSYFTKDYNMEKYLTTIKEAKKNVSIPIIASINCSKSSGWIEYAAKIENAGADALELNIFILPTDISISAEKQEAVYFDIVESVKKIVSIPVSIKISSYFSSLSHTIVELSKTSDGIVMFNKFYDTDIDLEKMEIIPSNRFSNHANLSKTLKWIGLLSNKVECDLVATNGIHKGLDIVKSILSGAKAVEIVSVIYEKGPEYIETMLKEMQSWMETKGYSSINNFIGKLNSSNPNNSKMYERSQFMKYFGEYKQ